VCAFISVLVRLNCIGSNLVIFEVRLQLLRFSTIGESRALCLPARSRNGRGEFRSDPITTSESIIRVRKSKRNARYYDHDGGPNTRFMFFDTRIRVPYSGRVDQTN